VEIPFLVKNAVIGVNQHPTWVLKAAIN